jgi:hypothetical protein
MEDLLDIQEVISPTQMMLLYLSESMDLDPVLPEICAVLGEELTIDFLRVFGGRTLRMPSVLDVKEGYLAITAHQKVDEYKRSMRVKDAVARAAAEMEVEEASVISWCFKVRGLIRYVRSGATDG